MVTSISYIPCAADVALAAVRAAALMRGAMRAAEVATLRP
jgi:hypothetical protein